MSKSKIIKENTQKFVDENKSFTSVDVSNQIKESGKWIKNSHVAKWLRKNVSKIWDSYSTEIIAVFTSSGKSTKAILYHEKSSNCLDYLQIKQKTISKNVFNAKINETTLKISEDEPVLEVNEEVSNSDSQKTLKINRNRLRIPKTIVLSVGLEAFDVVDPSKITINGKTINTKKPLSVHSDGRVYVRLEGQTAKICVEEGIIKIEA